MKPYYSSLLDDYLHTHFGNQATFRLGQKEAILSVLQRQRTLVVQKTGWGKSLVYFLAAKILRQEGSGTAIVISPLLSLMRNQIDSAKKFGLHALSIDSTIKKEALVEVKQELLCGKVDVLFISPERLSNPEFTSDIFPRIPNGISMLVIDEAHCISDWGHDFRPDYRRIARFIQLLAPNVPVLATTATANNRVVEDICEQLGQNLQIIRGELTRTSLRLQNIVLSMKEQRLAWLAQYINSFSGSGIIYCSTIADCEEVADWLKSLQIPAEHYHGQLKDEEKIYRENLLKENHIKVLVANIALGMGFDKDDIGFVIHYQIPSSLITYYQQIGRAGRNISQAYIVLLHGEEDMKIQRYFIHSAFPSIDDMRGVADIIAASYAGMKKTEIYQALNFSESRIDKCLKLLEVDQLIKKEGTKYYRTLNPFQLEWGRINNVITSKEQELQQMQKYVHSNSCLMQLITSKLDDPNSRCCGKCANCTGAFIPTTINKQWIQKAASFLRNQPIMIEPRKRWANLTNIPKSLQAEQGISLCRYGSGRYGDLVKKGKYNQQHFDDELVKASAIRIKQHLQALSLNTNFIVAAIPSLRRPALVPDFAKRVSDQLELPYIPLLAKTKNTPEQKEMQNSYQQQENTLGSLQVLKTPAADNLSIILIDDMVDSRWTFTIASYLLKDAGFKYVIPFALAKTSGKE